MVHRMGTVGRMAGSIGQWLGDVMLRFTRAVSPVWCTGLDRPRCCIRTSWASATHDLATTGRSTWAPDHCRIRRGRRWRRWGYRLSGVAGRLCRWSVTCTDLPNGPTFGFRPAFGVPQSTEGSGLPDESRAPVYGCQRLTPVRAAFGQTGSAAGLVSPPAAASEPGANGTTKQNVAPRPSMLSTQIRPPK